MTEELLTDALLREFLLGKANDEEQARIESLFLTDGEARERVLVVEQELIEDYLEDSLSTEDRETFLLRYGQTAAQRQQLRIDKAINEWALRESESTQAVPAGLSTWNRLRTRLRLRPVFVIPLAAATMIAIVVGGVWLNSRMERSAIARELAQLNTPASLSAGLPQMESRELSPVALRGTEQGVVLKKSADTAIFELRLPWIQRERYPAYRAEIRRVGDDETFSVSDLRADTGGRYAIRMRLPARILARGQYQILLTGINGDVASGTSEEYAFAVDE